MSNVYFTRTSTFKRLSISASKKDRPSTSAFDRLKMTNDQQQREMKSLKAKPFHEENDDDKIHSHVPSRMKRKLSVSINTEVEKIIFIFSHMLQPRGSSSSSSYMCCNRKDLHLLTYVSAERIIIFIFSHVLQPRGSLSSSSMCYNKEDHHLHLLTYAATERIFIFIFSHMLQLRDSSSSSSHIFERIFIFIFSHVLQPEDLHLLTCVVVERIFIFSHVLQPKGSSSSHMCCS
ncbi:hypothetical protein E6C27_scaffold30G001110 [Cucumis melo var. makuwa]|uniref:Uncharacterized protein n=1 Tax=Cucumis melo var. makuwa TaxID=1194695 RepID=A0A5A7TUQ7_CUCMM|nr:hypothetical protein E6C27_scaffold30G001110 [Cucumis melo var. makuwa]